MKEILRVGIDGRYLQNRRGIGNYVYNLLKEYKDRKNYHFYVFTIKGFVPTEDITAKNITFVKLPTRIFPIWEQILLPIYCYIHKIAILHCTSNSSPLILPKKTKLVLSIMDVMYMFESSKLEKSSSAYQRFGRMYLKYIVPLSARIARRIVTISHASMIDIENYIPSSRGKISVVYLCGNFKEEFSSHSSVRLEKEPYVLCLGALDPRKNTALLFEAFKILAQCNELNINLIVCGLNKAAIEKFSAIIALNDLSSKCQLIGYVEDSQLANLYINASLFVFPSLYEGFGLPLLEAMRYGVPVIATNQGSIPEICENAAIYFDACDASSLAISIKSLIRDESKQMELRTAGKERLKYFSWQRTADQTLKLYSELIFE